MLKKQVLFGCALALVVAGKCVGMNGAGNWGGMVGNGNAMANYHVNPLNPQTASFVAGLKFIMVACVLKESSTPQSTQNGNQWAAPVVHNGKGSVKRGKKSVARVAYARELKESFDAASQKVLDGIADDAEIRVAVKDQGYCRTGQERAVVGELSQPVYTAFMRAYRAMYQHLLAKGYNRAERRIKLQDFCEWTIALIGGENFENNEYIIRRLFCLARDEKESTPFIEWVVRMHKRDAMHRATENADFIELFNKMAWSGATVRSFDNQGELGLEDLLASMTLGEEDAAADHAFYAWLDEELWEEDAYDDYSEDGWDTDRYEEDEQSDAVEDFPLRPGCVVAMAKPEVWPTIKKRVSVKPETAPRRRDPVQRSVQRCDEVRVLTDEDRANINLIEEAQKEAIIAAKKLKETRTPASERAARKLRKRRKKVPLSDDEWVVGFSVHVSPALKKEIKRLKSRVRAVLVEAESLAKDVAMLREYRCSDVEGIIMPSLVHYEKVLNFRADSEAIKNAFASVYQELTPRVGATRQKLKELEERFSRLAGRSAARQNKAS